MKNLKIYVAGKVSKGSVFGTHYWRDEFCAKLSELCGLKIENLDPTKLKAQHGNAETIFGADCYLISTSDAVVVYLTDDISVGGSQEILIAKYFGLPVIGLAPYGGKFNGSTREQFGKIINNYKDPFVFTTCDVVCKDIDEVAATLKKLKDIKPKTIDIISELAEKYSRET